VDAEPAFSSYVCFVTFRQYLPGKSLFTFITIAMKLFFKIFFLFCSVTGYSQILFERASGWEELSKRALAEKKLIFIHLDDDQCPPCRDNASEAFSSDAVKDKFAREFVSVRLDLASPEGAVLAKRFAITEGPLSLFVDTKGNVLTRMKGASNSGFIYSEQADIAQKRRSGPQLTDLAKQYEAGERSLKFFETYITKKAEAGENVRALLADYSGRLPLDSLTSIRTIRFVFSHGPTLDSKVYKAMQAITPRPVMDSVYKLIPLSQASAMNNAIITSSMEKAIAEKNRDLAMNTAYFAQNSHGGDYVNGRRAYLHNTLNYYDKVKDTLQFINQAKSQIDNFHMRITVDSLKRMDMTMMNRYKQPPVGVNGKLSMPPMQFAPPSQFFHRDLNQYAWRVFEMSDKSDDLERALTWSYYSQELFNGLTRNTAHPMRLGHPAYLDTYAQILYKLGRVDEAIEWQTKAVDAQKVTGSKDDRFAQTLEKMKDGTLLSK
jgi:tetratricopeptide (TPR) repeat protein